MILKYFTCKIWWNFKILWYLIRNLNKGLISAKIVAPITINNYLKSLDNELKVNVLNINSHPRFTGKYQTF